MLVISRYVYIQLAYWQDIISITVALAVMTNSGHDTSTSYHFVCLCVCPTDICYLPCRSAPLTSIGYSVGIIYATRRGNSLFPSTKHRKTCHVTCPPQQVSHYVSQPQQVRADHEDYAKRNTCIYWYLYKFKKHHFFEKYKYITRKGEAGAVWEKADVIGW